MNVDKKDYVKLEMLNQRISELQQSLDLARQQLEHSSVALDVLNTLKSSKLDQELLVPIGSGVFITVNAKDISNVKMAVGAGVIVDKSVLDAISFINDQSSQIQDYYSQTLELYDQVVSKAMSLQEEIEFKMRSS